MQWSLRNVAGLGFGLVAALLLINAILAYRNTSKVQRLKELTADNPDGGPGPPAHALGSRGIARTKATRGTGPKVATPLVVKQPCV